MPPLLEGLHRELPPAGQQVPQPGIGTGQPDSTLTIFVGTGPVRSYRPTRHRAVQRHALVLAVDRTAEAGPGVQPVAALFVAQHHAQHLLPLRKHPRRCLEATVGAAHGGTGHRADPQAAVGLGGQAIDQQAGDDVGADTFEVGPGPARYAMLGTNPQAAVGQGCQIRNRCGRQAARIVGLRQEALQPILVVQPVQPSLVGTEPDRTVRLGRQAPDRVGPHQRLAAAVVEVQLAAVGGHPHQAGSLGPDPELVARIDQHRPDPVVAQSVFRTPDPP
ncbi:hypothetical protein G6F63_013558 [Rhizopus arrhizus]|nr:hypothetical protein G6F63_013558 [Rhizopus arrhizus]